jgi:DNA-directed RNA polymerase specialized sigma24 family protein
VAFSEPAGFLLRVLLGPELAEDVTAETFLAAFGCRDRYDGAWSDARPWLAERVTAERLGRTIEQIRARLPASVAIVEELPPDDGADPATGRWFRVQLQAERLDWLPPLLASLDRPFVVDRPDELRDLIVALADRLAASARRNAPRE